MKLRRIVVTALITVLALPILAFQAAPAFASASMSVSGSSSVIVGNNVTLSVYVNTGGASANAFQGTISYPAGLFDGVRGSFSGSICSLPVMQPDPSGGSATFSCGSPGGFNGSGLVATITLLATAPGSGSYGLSGCTVLANDGRGTDISGGCSGSSVTVSGAPTPVPVVAATPTPTPKPATVTPTPKVTAKPSATPTPSNNVQATKAAETPQPTAVPTAVPTPGADVALPAETPTPSPGPEVTPTPSNAPTRSVSQAFRDMFASVQSFKLGGKDMSGTAAVLLTLLPFMALLFAIVFFAYRLYLLERRRRRTMDRLFEMELSELAALEGKMDLLAEKGQKGREEYRDEFEKAKSNILRQLRPDYGKPVESAKAGIPVTADIPPQSPEK